MRFGQARRIAEQRRKPQADMPAARPGYGAAELPANDIARNNNRERGQRLCRFQRVDRGAERLLQNSERVGEKYSLLRHTSGRMGTAGTPSGRAVPYPLALE